MSSIYKQITIFRNDAEKLEEAVKIMNEKGINTDVPCTVQEMIERCLQEMVDED